jgi:hypothetical protein
MGAFVEAEITGREFAGLTRLPRSALSGGRDVFVVNTNDELESRRVEVLRTDDESVWIASGLAAGERVCAHVPSALAPGALVRAETLASAR